MLVCTRSRHGTFPHFAGCIYLEQGWELDKDPNAVSSGEKSENGLGLISRVKSVGRGDNKVVNKDRKMSKHVHILRTH